MLLIVICFAFILFVFRFGRRPLNFPPGPPLIPVLGNTLSLWLKLKRVKYHHRVWQSWSKQYGDILGLKLGSINIVVVSGKKFIHEVVTRRVFDGRPSGAFYMARSFGKKLGIVFADGESWKITRQLVLKYLKSFGYGTQNMESYITTECEALVRLRLSDAGKPVLINPMFDLPVLNILWRLVAGVRFDLQDEKASYLCNRIKRSFKIVDMTGGLMNFLPFLKRIIPGYIGYTEIENIHKEIYGFLRATVSEHRESLNTRNPRDVIDTFLIEMLDQKNQEAGIPCNLVTEEELLVVCLDLFEAGLETVSNTAAFLLAYLVKNEQVQKKLRKEIGDVIGYSRLPRLSDRSRMLYTEAVILEILRISSVAPVGIPHVASEDTYLDTYLIPKDTILLTALHDLHNSSQWVDPEVFRPERFLTKEGNLIQNDCFLPFGAGRRRCIGESLARCELFLFLTYLVQKFHMRTPPEDPTPSTEPINGVSLSPQPFKVVFHPIS